MARREETAMAIGGKNFVGRKFLTWRRKDLVDGFFSKSFLSLSLSLFFFDSFSRFGVSNFGEDRGD